MIAPNWLPMITTPGSVFFPGTMLPITTLSPSGQDLANRCLTEGQRIVLVMEQHMDVHLDGSQSYVPKVGTEAQVLSLGHGNSFLGVLIHGVGRVLLKEEKTPLPYRLAKVRRLDDCGEVNPDEAHLLHLSLASLALYLGSEGGTIAHLNNLQLPPEKLADLVSATLPNTAWSKQRILEAVDINLRVQLAVGMVAEFMARLHDVICREDEIN